MAIEKIHPAEIPVVRTKRDFWVAAGRLAAGNAVFVIPKEVVEAEEPIGESAEVWAAAIKRFAPQFVWMMAPAQRRDSTELTDLGMHGNPHNFVDHAAIAGPGIHHHTNSEGEHVLTTAEIGPRFFDNPNAEEILTLLLREGYTDSDLALPSSFRQARVREGDSVIFTLNGGPGTDPLLHDFYTQSPFRVAHIAAIAGIHSLAAEAVARNTAWRAV